MGESDAVAKLTDDAFIKKACRGELTFVEQALRDTTLSQELLITNHRGKFDQKDPRFKEVVRFQLFYICLG